MPSLFTYWNTLRHLRPTQFYWRLRSRIFQPPADLRPGPSLRALSRPGWAEPAHRDASMVGPARFRFLNESHDLTGHDWDDPGREKLWRYNLHYFDDLNAKDAGSRATWHHNLLNRWIHDNPPGTGTGWEPYPTSIRIVNWIKWALGGNLLPREAVHSLAVQARWLSRRMEHHLLGNHLFSNAKALVFAGLFCDGSEAQAWLEQGLQVLTREIHEQILPDGGQFERSTLYHALALEDMLDLCNLSSVFESAIALRWRPTIALLREVTGPMRGWLAAMCHPDGEISYFNDAAKNIAPAPIELERYAARLGLHGRSAPGESLTHLAASGYVRVEWDGAVAILDVAPVGPDYLPGHAHADTLSFELSLFGQRVLVNSGTSCYGLSDERSRQRGTAAHNTVVVDAKDSSEVWAGFRVARRARPHGLQIARNGAILVRCSHDGYRRLRGKPEHLREWSCTPSALMVEDRLSGSFGRAQARFHLHPSVTLERGGIDSGNESRVQLKVPHGQSVGFSIAGGRLRTEESTWHPEFGRSEPSICLAVDFDSPTLRTMLNWDDPA